MIEIPDFIYEMAKRLRTQDNRATAHPMFLVQIRRVHAGVDKEFSDNKCWYHPEWCETVYDEIPDAPDYQDGGWQGPYGYWLYWETVMTCMTEKGAEEYLGADRHNLESKAHKGEVRIYVDSFWRCREMVRLRKWLMALEKPVEGLKELREFEARSAEIDHEIK